MTPLVQATFDDAWDAESTPRSDVYRDGLMDGVVAALTGDFRPCGWRAGSAEHDAWTAGWDAGFTAGENANRERSAAWVADYARAAGAA